MLNKRFKYFGVLANSKFHFTLKLRLELNLLECILLKYHAIEFFKEF